MAENRGRYGLGKSSRELMASVDFKLAVTLLRLKETGGGPQALSGILDQGIQWVKRSGTNLLQGVQSTERYQGLGLAGTLYYRIGLSFYVSQPTADFLGENNLGAVLTKSSITRYLFYKNDEIMASLRGFPLEAYDQIACEIAKVPAKQRDQKRLVPIMKKMGYIK